MKGFLLIQKWKLRIDEDLSSSHSEITLNHSESFGLVVYPSLIIEFRITLDIGEHNQNV